MHNQVAQGILFLFRDRRGLRYQSAFRFVSRKQLEYTHLGWWDSCSLEDTIEAEIPMFGFCCSPRHPELARNFLPHLLLESVIVLALVLMYIHTEVHGL